MAVFRLTVVLSMLALLLGSFVYVCQTCSPPEGWQHPTLVDRILEAQSVLYGVVRKTYPHQYHRRAYTVELEVYCILKGPKTPLVVNITDAGYIDGHCAASEFKVNGVYIALAAVDGGTDQRPIQLNVRPGMTSANIDATQENLNGIRKACSLNPVTRPDGSTSSTECPVSASDCQSEPTPRRDRLEPIKPIDRKPNTGSAVIASVATTLAAVAAVALATVGV